MEKKLVPLCFKILTDVEFLEGGCCTLDADPKHLFKYGYKFPIQHNKKIHQFYLRTNSYEIYKKVRCVL